MDSLTETYRNIAVAALKAGGYPEYCGHHDVYLDYVGCVFWDLQERYFMYHGPCGPDNTMAVPKFGGGYAKLERTARHRLYEKWTSHTADGRILEISSASYCEGKQNPRKIGINICVGRYEIALTRGGCVMVNLALSPNRLLTKSLQGTSGSADYEDGFWIVDPSTKTQLWSQVHCYDGDGEYYDTVTSSVGPCEWTMTSVARYERKGSTRHYVTSEPQLVITRGTLEAKVKHAAHVRRRRSLWVRTAKTLPRC